MRRTIGSVLVMVAAMVAGALATPVPGAVADEPPAAPPPSPPKLYVVSDSVVLGARSAIVERFADHQVTVDGVPAIFTEVAAQLAWERRALIGDVAIVATGYNYPHWDPARFDRSIDTMVDRLTAAGARRIIWVTLRERIVAPNNASTRSQIRRYAWYFGRVNEHLVRALDRHPTLELADWAAISGVPGITYDAIHLNGRGAALMADLLRTTVDAGAHRVPAGTTARLPAGTGIGRSGPLMVWVEARSPVRDGQLRLDDCAGGPATVVDLWRNRTRRALVAVHTGDAQVCATPTAAAEVSLSPAGPVPPPGERRTLTTTAVRAGGTAVVAVAPATGTRLVEVTVRAASSSGPVTVWPCAATARPGVSQLTASPSLVVSTVVALDAAGDVCIHSVPEATVGIDELGVWASAPTTAVRLADTRAGAPVVGASVAVADAGPGPSVVHVTVIGGQRSAQVGVGPCDGGLVTGRVDAGEVATLSLVASGALCAGADVPVHVVVDRDGPWPS